MSFSRTGRRSFLVSTLATSLATPSWAMETVEPRFQRSPSPGDGRRLALTLDACAGGFDERIAEVLVRKEIKTTIFLTTRWMKRNPAGLRYLLDHRAVFTFENHGARHVPPVLGEGTLYGLPIAGTLDAVRREVEDGAREIKAATGVKTTWYRGATARYSPKAIEEIKYLDHKIAAYSLNADQGASLSAAGTAAQMEKARDGDVIIGHINQPGRSAGKGIVEGVLALHKKGFMFVTLNDLDPHEQPPDQKKPRIWHGGPEIVL